MARLRYSTVFLSWFLAAALGAGAACLAIRSIRPVRAASANSSGNILRFPSLLVSPSNANMGAGYRDGGLQVQENPAGLLLDIQVPQPVVEEIASGDQACQVLRLDGYGENGISGTPRLPVKGLMLGIPPRSQPHVQVIEAESEVLAGRFDLCPGGTPLVGLGPQGQVVSRGESMAQDEDVYGRDSFTPSGLAEIADVGYLRSQRIALLRVYPFQYNPVTGELRYYRHLRLSVGVDGIDPGADPSGNAAAVPSPVVDEGPFEETLKETLLNYETARRWRLSPQSLAQVSPGAPTAGPAYKVVVQNDGLYQVTYADLLAAGVPVAGIDPRTFHLANRGVEVAIYVSGEADRLFDPVDYLLFYGQSAGTRYTDQNVYWLTWGGEHGLRMSVVDGAPVGASLAAYFPARQHIERNERYVPSYPSGPDLDRWYWTYIMAVTPQTYTYTFDLHNLYTTTPMSATVRGLFRGYAADPRHHTQVYLNGHLLKDDIWYADAEYSFQVNTSQSYLLEGENKLVVKAPLGSGISYDYFLVNWFEVDDYAKFVAQADQLDFKVATSGTWEYQLSGFTRDALGVYDITAPQSPQRVLGGLLEASGSGYQLRFKATIAQERRYLALTDSQWQKPQSITLDAPSDLHSATNAADYLVIAYDDFYDQVLPLAAFRQGQGLRAKVVRLQDVYDEFSYGLVDPQAIHDFLAYTYATWARPAPSYVLLVGDGNYDFKNDLGTGEVSYVPPYLADVDPWMGETANENYYVSVSGGDILPDMHLGRLPVKTQAETTALVNKIIGYEQAATLDDWNQNVLFIADDADSAGNFASLSDAIAGGYLPSAYTARKLYYKINYSTPAAMKAAILQSINQGALLVNYIGHAGRQWWASEQFLYYTDVDALTNAGRLPLMVPMTCLDGYFINPSPVGQDRSSLAESLVRPESKGAIASWSPTGLGVSVGHDYLNRGLYQAFFRDYVAEIGAAATLAKVHLYSNSAGFRDLIQTYALMGDPATRLAILRPELNLSKTASPETVLHPGSALTYTLVFSNSGPISATQVVISDVLPAGLLNPLVSSSGVTITPRPGTRFVWDVADLLPGQGGVITLTGQFDAKVTGRVTNTAWMDSLGALAPVTDSASAAFYWLYYFPLIAH